MNDKERIEFQSGMIETLQSQYDNMVAYYDGIEDELTDMRIELAQAQKMIAQMGFNEFSFTGAERKTH